MCSLQTLVDISPRDNFDFDLDPRIGLFELGGRLLHYFRALGLCVRVPETDHSLFSPLLFGQHDGTYAGDKTRF